MVANLPISRSTLVYAYAIDANVDASTSSQLSDIRLDYICLIASMISLNGISVSSHQPPRALNHDIDSHGKIHRAEENLQNHVQQPNPPHSPTQYPIQLSLSLNPLRARCKADRTGYRLSSV